MIETSRQIKALLLALTIGVWGLLARSFFLSDGRDAAPPPPVKRVYVASSDKDGKLFFDNTPGNIGFDARGLLAVTNEANRQGIKIHSVILSGPGGYVILVEK